MIPDPSPPFEVDSSANFKSLVRRMIDRAHQLGCGEAIEFAIAQIFYFLLQTPREWGDPIRDFRHAQFTQYHGRHEHFLCVYHVHERLPMVVVTHLIPQEGNSLFGEAFDV